MPRRRNAWDWYLFYKDNGGLTLKPAVVFVSECIISQQEVLVRFYADLQQCVCAVLDEAF